MDNITAIKLMPETKEQVEIFAQQVVNEVLEGGILDPLEVDIRLKAMEKMIELIRKNWKFKNAVREEADKYSGKDFVFNGYSVTKSQRTTYDYKSLKDAELIRLTAAIKAREVILKQGVDMETGEVLPKPKAKISEFLTIKLK